ncbi:hypothetical protein IM40_04005 [Candidatus Paracaedimonas acanthamoebae]|nr:hypothetical protein IM40_04005 [Candidatus Paracaedimonas acanthamoebae]
MNRKVKRYFRIFLFTFLAVPQNHSFASKHCDLGDIYHHGPKVICLGERPNLSSDQLDHFFEKHFDKNAKILSLRCQEELTDAHLKWLSKLPQTATIIELNLSRTSISYDGIVHLWKSEFLGSVRDEQPIYESYYNTPISVVKVEIGHTKALKQYKKHLKNGKKIFPLPLRNKFEIRYVHPAIDVEYKEIGLKQILLTDHGEPIGN